MLFVAQAINDCIDYEIENRHEKVSQFSNFLNDAGSSFLEQYLKDEENMFREHSEYSKLSKPNNLFCKND